MFTKINTQWQTNTITAANLNPLTDKTNKNGVVKQRNMKIWTH